MEERGKTTDEDKSGRVYEWRNSSISRQVVFIHEREDTTPFQWPSPVGSVSDGKDRDERMCKRYYLTLVSL